jgi:hypothetical protein
MSYILVRSPFYWLVFGFSTSDARMSNSGAAVIVSERYTFHADYDAPEFERSVKQIYHSQTCYAILRIPSLAFGPVSLRQNKSNRLLTRFARGPANFFCVVFAGFSRVRIQDCDHILFNDLPGSNPVFSVYFVRQVRLVSSRAANSCLLSVRSVVPRHHFDLLTVRYSMFNWRKSLNRMGNKILRRLSPPNSLLKFRMTAAFSMTRDRAWSNRLR